MSGNYYMLPPFDEATLNCQWGTVTFEKIASHEVLTPPTIEENEDVELEA